MSNNADNIVIRPINAIFGYYQKQEVTCAADIASSHNNDYFVLYSALDAVKYHIWYNVAGAGTDPAPAGSTPIMVAIAVNASASTVASATAAAIHAVANFIARADQSKVIIRNAQPGLSTTVASGVGLVGFAYELKRAGSKDELGFLDGDVEISPEESLNEITAHQSGTTAITSLRQGKKVGVKMTLKETNLSNLQLLLKQGGDEFTPGGGTKVVGWGSSTDAQNIIDQAGKLVLHPESFDSSDRSEDFNFWRAYLTPDSITISGENPRVASLNFNVYQDTDREQKVDIWFVGDSEQTGNFKKS